MKEKVISFFIFALFFMNLFALSAEDNRFVPYYQFNFSEGLSAPSKGDFFANHEVDTKAGAQWAVTDRFKLFGLYDLSYEGPGLNRSEGRLFTERAIRHSLMAEPSYEFPVIGALKTRVFGIFEKRRSGTNELWGKGLYDYKAYGGSLGVAKKLGDWSVTPSVRYTIMKFPNYTDLLREFQSGGLTAEIAGGLIDQNVYGAGVFAARKNITLSADYNQQNFKKEKIVESNGTYGSNNQQDKTVGISGEGEYTVWRFTTIPKVSINLKRSNQNFLKFAFFGDTSPVFVAKNYDYNEVKAGSTFLTRLTQRKYIYTGLDANWRNYTNRPPRDGSGNYISGKQKNFWATYSFGYRWKSTEYTTWTLAYSFVFATSNMKFESFIPYNYTGQMIGMYFTVNP